MIYCSNGSGWSLTNTFYLPS